MHRMLKLSVGVVSLVVVGVVGGIGYLKTSYPKVGPARALAIEATPARLERGKYLAYHVAVCMDCHSTRDWSKFAGPMVPGTEGKGGERFDEKMGFPGQFFAKNITPASLKGWSDGEILRAFTEGVSRTGEPYFPVMPYPGYGQMSEDDAQAIVAYIRTLAPIENEVPASHAAFPMSLIMRTIPKPASFAPAPDTANVVQYGRYLTKVAGCAECHTRREKGEFVQGMDFAGGAEFAMPSGTLRSANITPDEETGIGRWTKDAFIARFKKFEAAPVAAGEFQTIMPWTMYQGMTEQDLGSIYEYLRTAKPIRNSVNRYSPVEAKANL